MQYLEIHVKDYLALSVGPEIFVNVLVRFLVSKSCFCLVSNLCLMQVTLVVVQIIEQSNSSIVRQSYYKQHKINCARAFKIFVLFSY